MTDTQMFNPRQATIYRAARRAGREWAETGKRYDPSVVVDVTRSLLRVAHCITLTDDEISFAVDQLREGFESRVLSYGLVEGIVLKCG